MTVSGTASLLRALGTTYPCHPGPNSQPWVGVRWSLQLRGGSRACLWNGPCCVRVFMGMGACLLCTCSCLCLL